MTFPMLTADMAASTVQHCTEYYNSRENIIILLWKYYRSEAWLTAKTKCRKFETNIPRQGISGPQSQFQHSCVCERIIYSHDGSACRLTQKKIQNPCYQIRYCTKVKSTGAILVSFCLQQHALLSQSMRQNSHNLCC